MLTEYKCYKIVLDPETAEKEEILQISLLFRIRKTGRKAADMAHSAIKRDNTETEESVWI